MALFGKKKTTEASPVPAGDPFGMAPQSLAPTAPALLEPPKPKLKARADVYTLLLGLSALAMTIAFALLLWNVIRYNADPVSGMITLF